MKLLSPPSINTTIVTITTITILHRLAFSTLSTLNVNTSYNTIDGYDYLYDSKSLSKHTFTYSPFSILVHIKPNKIDSYKCPNGSNYFNHRLLAIEAHFYLVFDAFSISYSDDTWIQRYHCSINEIGSSLQLRIRKAWEWFIQTLPPPFFIV